LFYVFILTVLFLSLPQDILLLKLRNNVMKKMPGISNKKRAEVQEHLTRLLSYEQPKTIKICQQWEALIKSNQLSDDDPLYSPLVFVLARFYGMQHKLDKSLYYIDMAERMAIKYGNHLAEFKAKSNRAIILVEQQNYFEAIKVWTELLKDV
jgi:tetratricopeptide (TPR) repeat protein